MLDDRMVNEREAADGTRTGEGKRTTWEKTRSSVTLISIISTWHDQRSKKFSGVSAHFIRRYTDSAADTLLNNLMLINEQPNEQWVKWI
jgi:hypothetical protein